MILVVDDDRRARELMIAVLEPLGECVVACASAAEALREIAARVPRLVFTDRSLSGMDGLALIRSIRAAPSTSKVRVIMVSGDASPGAAEQALAAGADGYLLKPVALATLVSEAERGRREG